MPPVYKAKPAPPTPSSIPGRPTIRPALPM